MIKTLFSLTALLISFSSVSLTPMVQANVEPDHHSTWTKWSDSTSLPDKGGSYYLDTDVILNKNWNVSGSTTLCLNGHVINLNGNNQITIINGTGDNLNITDCDTTTEHYFKTDVSPWQMVGEEDKNNENVETIKGGVITGGTIGAFSLYLEDLFMTNGSIVGNSNDSGAAAIGISGDFGYITLNNVNICGNKGSNGGAIGSSTSGHGGTYTLNNCDIHHNEATSSGGAIYVSSSVELRIRETKIRDNLSARLCGGIHIQNSCEVHIESNSVVKNNISKNIYANGIGVYLADKGQYEGSSKCILSGGSIVENNYVDDVSNCQIAGNNVYVGRSNSFEMRDGIISDCNKPNVLYGGGVYVSESASASFEKVNDVSPLIKNCSARYGGAIYVREGGSVTAHGLRIENCNALWSGGGIYSEGNLSLQDTEIKHCNVGPWYEGCTYETKKDTSYGAGIDFANANSSTLFLGGDTVIEDNILNLGTYGNTKQSISNVFLDYNRLIDLAKDGFDSPSNNMRVGISTRYNSDPITISTPDVNVANYVNNFFSDNESYEVSSDSTNNTLILTKHIHDLTHIEQVDSTEEEYGCLEYWHCEKCGHNYKDSNANSLIEDLDEWKENEGRIAKKDHRHKGNLTYVPGQEPTQNEPGWKGYYECKCGRLFEDEDGLMPIFNLEEWKQDIYGGYIAPLRNNNNKAPTAGEVVGSIFLWLFILLILAYVASFFLWKYKDFRIPFVYPFLAPTYRFINKLIWKTQYNEIEIEDGRDIKGSED